MRGLAYTGIHYTSLSYTVYTSGVENGSRGQDLLYKVQYTTGSTYGSERFTNAVCIGGAEHTPVAFSSIIRKCMVLLSVKQSTWAYFVSMYGQSVAVCISLYITTAVE